MLRVFPSRIELAPRDILEAIQRLQHRREARRSQIAIEGSIIQSSIYDTNIAGHAYAFPPPPSEAQNQLLASYPSNQPDSLQPQSYADLYDDSRRIFSEDHSQIAFSGIEDKVMAPSYTRSFSHTAASFSLDGNQLSAELRDSYATHLFHSTSPDSGSPNQPPKGQLNTSSEIRRTASRFFDGFDDDTDFLEAFSESLDLNSTNPLSATRGGKSQAPEPSDGQLSEFEAPCETSSRVPTRMPRLMDVYRLMSRETLPRSPLHISEAAISSSPEKTKAEKRSHEDSLDTETLIQEPKSGLWESRLRLNSYARSSSDIDDMNCSRSDVEKMSLKTIPSAAPSEEYDQTDGASVIHHSPPILDGCLHLAYDNIQGVSFGQYRGASPSRFEETMPVSGPPDIFREPVEAPSTPRYLAYPARRPLRQTGEQQTPLVHQEDVNFHSALGRYSPSPTPPPPGMPFRSIQIYNDQLSPSSQPQTPRDRHGGPFDPALTAPAVPGGQVDSRWMWQGGRRRRPDRTGSPEQDQGWDEEQENASVEGERNRLVRRLMNRSGVMRRVNSWIRREDAEELDRTPPSESFRWY